MHSDILLYSFRRCPYAIRVRLALLYSQAQVLVREIELKNKPQAMLDVSPKGTVPVLVKRAEDRPVLVIDESLDIMHWALNQNDPENLLRKADSDCVIKMDALISENDNGFKGWLDKYKYAGRFPEHPQAYYRHQGEDFLQKLEDLLRQNRFLFSDKPCLADIALFPFVRQFAHVDKAWSAANEFPELKIWLDYWQNSPVFIRAMEKFEPWLNNGKAYLFGK